VDRADGSSGPYSFALDRHCFRTPRAIVKPFEVRTRPDATLRTRARETSSFVVCPSGEIFGTRVVVRRASRISMPRRSNDTVGNLCECVCDSLADRTRPPFSLSRRFVALGRQRSTPFVYDSSRSRRIRVYLHGAEVERKGFGRRFVDRFANVLLLLLLLLLLLYARDDALIRFRSRAFYFRFSHMRHAYYAYMLVWSCARVTEIFDSKKLA